MCLSISHYLFNICLFPVPGGNTILNCILSQMITFTDQHLLEDEIFFGHQIVSLYVLYTALPSICKLPVFVMVTKSIP